MTTIPEVTKKIITLKGQEELDQFFLSRGEYAKMIGKTPNAVRMMMRRGRLSGEYRFNGKKFLFRSTDRTRVCPDQMVANNHAIEATMTTPKSSRKINRGNHFNANYPNEAFRLHNEEKKRLAILNKIEGKFVSKAHELAFNELNNEALKVSLNNTQKRAIEQFTPLKDYGGPIGLRYGRRGLRRADPENLTTSTSFKPHIRYYDNNFGSYDDGSIEVQVPRSSPQEPHFKNKVDESIWRLKNRKY